MLLSQIGIYLTSQLGNSPLWVYTTMFPSGEPGVSGDFWGSQEGCQGPSRLQGGTGDFP